MAAHPPLTPFGSALAGALGAVFANATVYPLDTAKTRLQALPQEVLERESAPSTSSSSSSSRKDELSLRNIHALPRVLLAKLRKWQLLMLLVRIIKTEGISGAFKGFSASMINTFSQQFAYFFFHTFLRSRALKRRPALSTSSELALGAAAGALAQIFTIPVAVIATRQQLWVEPSSSATEGSSASKQRRAGAPSLLETAHEIIAESGITGLWTGLKPGLVLTANPAITYGVFERLKAWRLARNGAPAGKLTVGEAFWLGVTSKTLATIVTYPYIFAKVRLQAAKPARKAVPPPKGPSYAEIASHDPAPEAPVVAADSHALDAAEKAAAGTAPVVPVQPRGAIALLRQVYKEHGIAGWYQGLGAQIFKAVLCQGILFVSKEQFEGYAWIILTFLEGVRARAAPVTALAKAAQ